MKSIKLQFTFLSIFFFNFLLANSIVPEGFRSPDGLFFIENKGQWESNVFFKMNMDGAKLSIERNRLNFLLIDPNDLAKKSHKHQFGDNSPTKVHCHRFYVNFVGSNENAKSKATKKISSKHNYFLGKDKSKWASNVGLYEQAGYENIYDGIDMRLYPKGADLKYDFIVKSGYDPNQIHLEYKHVDNLFLKEGNLHVITSVNEIIEQKPIAFQYTNNKKKEIPCVFKLIDNQVRFYFPEGYDQNHDLIIDPMLIFSTYSGATDDNWGTTATYDEAGNMYSAGVSFGKYPATTGAFDTEEPGFFSTDPGDMGISKYSADGMDLIYSTYLGGSEMDTPHSLIVNSKGELIVMGTTSSRDYPTSVAAFDTTFSGGSSIRSMSSLDYDNGSDIIITIFNDSGSELIGSTYVGGSDNDGLHIETQGVRLNYSDDLRGEVIVDDSDNIYVASTTSSSDFPTTNNAFDTFYTDGEEDAVIFKLNPNASDMIWSSFLGGEGFDAAFSIVLDDDNRLYACGVTTSTEFPKTSNGLYSELDGATSSGFVALISKDGSELLSVTYLHNSDFAYFVDLDSDNQVFVIGQSEEANYPISVGVYSNVGSTLFLQKLSSDLSQSRFSTLLGNGRGAQGILVPSAFKVNKCDQIFISAWAGGTNNTSSAGLEVTSSAFQQQTDGADFYFMVLAPDAAKLNYATYYGGRISNEHVDGGTSRIDDDGVIYQAICAGCGGNNDLPTTNSYSPSNGSSNCNTGSVKYSVDCSDFPSSTEEQIYLDELTILPNPANDFFEIKNETPHQIHQLLMYNQLGSLVRRIEHPSPKVMIKNEASGLYFLRLELENGVLVVRRLVVEN